MSVTILMPAYNGAAFLARSLKSISEQTYRDWRVFVGDDGSTDDSHAVIARSGLPRLTLRHNARNIGWAQTVNLLLADVDTEYVAVLHQDDWWEPSFLATVTAMMDRSPASVLAVTAARVVHPSRPDAVWGLHQGWPTEQGSTCPSSVAVSLLLPADPIRCPAVLARTELYRKYSFDESLPYACDWLMWLRAAVMGSVEVSAEVLANYQLHEASQTTSLTRASLTTIDLLRMIEVLRTEWAGGREPVKDAIGKLTAGITDEILADAGLKIEGGDLAGAEVQLRFARAIAPSIRQSVLGLAGHHGISLLRLPLMASLSTPITRLGRRLW